MNHIPKMRIGIRDIRRCASTTYTHTDIGFSTPARYILVGFYYYANYSMRKHMSELKPDGGVGCISTPACGHFYTMMRSIYM